MALIRAEARAALHPWREVIAAAALGLFGLWLVALGGYLLVPLGSLAIGLAAVWGVQARRRMRFSQRVEAPGMVEVDEGQVGYLGPSFGGFVALPDLVEIRVVVIHGKRLWRLKQADGQALLIPVAATGAEKLFDAFSTLPGLDTEALVEAASGKDGEGMVWRRDRNGLRLVQN
jgi:hypothetical protein